MWLLQYFIRDPIKAALTARTTEVKRKDEKFRKCCQIVNRFLGSYDLENFISEKEKEMIRFSHR